MASNHSEPVRLAILGAGTIGTIHGLASLDAPEAVVSSVWSRSFSKAQALAHRLGARAFRSVEEAVEHPEVDAAVVCTPTFLHQRHAMVAIRARKAVICEKPLAGDLDAAESLIDAAGEARVPLLVAHVVRFFPEFRRLYDLVKGGVVGQVALVRMSRAASFPHGSDDWHNQLDLSGGVTLDMGIHDLDWLLWTLGPAERVYARGLYPQRRSFLDYALITLRLRLGAIAHVEASWAEAEGFRVHGEVSGDQGLLTYDSLNSDALRIELRDAPESPPGVNVPTSYTAESPYVSQLRHFARCIRGQDQPIIAPQEARESLRVALAALESMTTGQPVNL